MSFVSLSIYSKSRFYDPALCRTVDKGLSCYIHLDQLCAHGKCKQRTQYFFKITVIICINGYSIHHWSVSATKVADGEFSLLYMYRSDL